MAKPRSYTPQQQAEVNKRYPGIEWRDGNPYTKQIQEDNGAEYLGANYVPGEAQESLVPAHTTNQNFPWEFLVLQAAAPALVAGGGALAGGSGASGGAGAGATYGGLPVGGLGSASTAGMVSGLSAPAGLGTAAATGGGLATGGGGGMGGFSGFMNSPLGMLLAKAGLDFGAGALGKDPVQPFQFSEVGGERGRLVNPANASYNSLRALMGLGMGVGRKLGQPIDMPNMPDTTPQVNVPGIPFSFGGVGAPSSSFPSQLPGFDFSLNGEDQLAGFYEKLLTPPPAPEVLGNQSSGRRSSASGTGKKAKLREVNT